MSPAKDKAAPSNKTAKAAISGAADAERSPEQIRTEIEETREEMGDTVAAVAAKTDVKAQAKAKVEDVKAQAKEKAEEAKGAAKELGEEAKAAAPKSPQEGLQKAQALAKENPKPFAIAGALFGMFLVWRVLRS
jgi:hypothetical protein